MARLIDAEALMDAFRTYMVERHDREKCVSEENCKTCDRSCLWRSVVSVAPTVDAVPVVRCKDCTVPHNKYTGCPELNGLVTPPDFYCPFGERKDGDGNG